MPRTETLGISLPVCVCVCVCVYIYKHTHTYTQFDHLVGIVVHFVRSKEAIQVDLTEILKSQCQVHLQCQGTLERIFFCAVGPANIAGMHIYALANSQKYSLECFYIVNVIGH